MGECNCDNSRDGECSKDKKNIKHKCGYCYDCKCKEPKECTCNIVDLMVCGCKCGAIKKKDKYEKRD